MFYRNNKIIREIIKCFEKISKKFYDFKLKGYFEGLNLVQIGSLTIKKEVLLNGEPLSFLGVGVGFVVAGVPAVKIK